MPQSKLSPRLPQIVVGHEVQPLPVLRDVRESNVEESLPSRHKDIGHQTRGSKSSPVTRHCVRVLRLDVDEIRDNEKRDK